MNRYNPIPDSLMETAERQLKEYHLEEQMILRVPLRRDLYIHIQRALAAQGKTVEQAVSEYLTSIVEEGEQEK